MFEIDWTRFVAWIWPPIIRQVFWVSFCRALIAPVVTVYNRFMLYRDDVMYKLAHTSQVWSIEKVLNDAFDPVSRRIYITDPGYFEVTLINRDTDEPPHTILQDAAGPILYISGDSAYAGGSYDFIVVLPYQFSASDIYRLRALVDYYKLAGKRYDIFQNSTI